MLTKADVQRLRSLRDKKTREALGVFVVESEKTVRELIAAGFPFEEVYATGAWIEKGNPLPSPAEPPGEASPQTKGQKDQGTRGLSENVTCSQRLWAFKESSGAGTLRRPIKITRITADEMARASHFPTPSSVLAVGRIARTPIARGALNRGLTLALDGVQDAGNVGTLLRIADWFALDRVVLSPDCADLFHQKVINASMGSFARVAAHTADLVSTFKDTTVPILGCELAGENVHTLPPLRDAVIVIGSEGRGLSPAVAARVTRRVTVPRFGGAELLNAAVAAAIVCDNLRRAAPAT